MLQLPLLPEKDPPPAGWHALRIGPIASTMMACPGMDEEDAFTKMLESVTHYDMDGPMLLLLSDGELRAVFQARP